MADAARLPLNAPIVTALPVAKNSSHLTSVDAAGKLDQPSGTKTQKVQHMTTATLERHPATTEPAEAAPARSIDLEFSSALEVHAGLEEAVAELIEVASRDASCGILVTRLHPGRYTVALDESVPFGETYEAIAA